MPALKESKLFKEKNLLDQIIDQIGDNDLIESL